jgi:hypothetical protein
MKPFFLPQRKQRLTARVVNLGFFCERATTEVFAIVLWVPVLPYGYAAKINSLRKS